MWGEMLQNVNQMNQTRRPIPSAPMNRLESMQLCGELEVEIIKMRREVERMRAVDDKKEVADVGAHADVQKLHKELDLLEDDCNQLQDELEKVVHQNNKIRLDLRQLDKERDDAMDEYERLKNEEKTLKTNRLILEAEMDQMVFFHDEMRILLQQFIMNEKLVEMETDKDSVIFRKQEEEYQSTIKSEIPKLQEVNRHLKEQLHEARIQRDELKIRVQSAADTNDDLNKDLDLLNEWDGNNSFFNHAKNQEDEGSQSDINYNRDKIFARWSIGDSTSNKKSIVNHNLRVARRRSYSESDLVNLGDLDIDDINDNYSA